MPQFFGGMPTAIDVQNIEVAIGLPTQGQDIPHEAIEQAIGVGRNSARYRTVTNAWRAKLRKAGIDIGAVRGEGFRVLTQDERVEVSYEGVASGVRKVGRSLRRAASVPVSELGQIALAKHDAVLLAGQAILQAAEPMRQARKISAPSKADVLPMTKAQA